MNCSTCGKELHYTEGPELCGDCEAEELDKEKAMDCPRCGRPLETILARVPTVEPDEPSIYVGHCENCGAKLTGVDNGSGLELDWE